MKRRQSTTFAKTLEYKYTNDRNYHKVKEHCHHTGKYAGAAHSICHLKYSIPKEVPLVFHSGSKYNYQFTIKELAKECEG